MNKVNELKRRSDCEYHVLQTNRLKRRKLECLSNDDALYVKKINLEKLPSNCLQNILSFMTYDKVSGMRLVGKVFNEIGKKLLNKRQKDLELRSKREIERAEMYQVHCSINARSSNDKLRLLHGLHKSINDCTTIYSCYADYFVAGKLLDEAHYLLKNLDSFIVVPYFIEHACDQKPHPLLGPVVAYAEKARYHFEEKIWDKFIYCDEEAEWERERLINLDLTELYEQNKRKILKTNLLNNLRQKIDCGNKMSEEFLKMILRLSKTGLDLTERAKQMDEKAERILNKKDLLGNCLVQSSVHSSSLLEKAKATGIPMEKRPNLATLPSFCITNIVSYFNNDKVAQMRAVCKSLNEVCKKVLNREVENLKQKFQFKIKFMEKGAMVYPDKTIDVIINMMKDVCSFFRLCEDICKQHLGTYYYFIAGKVLDEATRIYNMLFFPSIYLSDDFEDKYEFRPHYYLFRLMDLVYNAIAHFKFTIVPKYFPATQITVSDCIITDTVMNFEKESQLSLEDLDTLVQEAEVMIQKQNDRNRKFQKNFPGLKNKVLILNKKVRERINVLQELE